MSVNLTLVVLQNSTAFFNTYSAIKAKPVLTENVAWEKLIAQWFNLNTASLPFAALGTFKHSLANPNFYLRADPVYLQSDLAQVYLQPVAITAAEQLKIKQVLQPYLAQDHLQLHCVNNEWYLQLPESPQIATVPLINVIGKNIFAYLPKGREAQYWQRWMTEMQMVLSQAGIGQVNGIWLWGEGNLPQQKLTTQFDAVYTDLSWLQGLAQLADINLISDLTKLTHANYLVMLQDAQLEQQTIHLLLTKWRQQFDKIEIVLLDGIYQMQAGSWWRRFF